MSTPIAPPNGSPHAPSFRPLSTWAIAIATFALAASGCREDPADPGKPISPATGGLGSTSAGGSESGGTGNVPSTGSTGGGSTTTGNAEAVINLWYGEDQTFGTDGGPAPQKWINVLGDASASFLDTATYSLNGGAEVELPLGPDNERLAAPGDFNIELDRDSLAKLPETNRLAITLTVSGGAFLTKEFTLRVHDDGTASFPFEADWNQLVDISQTNQIAQVVDGKWELSGDGIQVATEGYDRLIALGDRSWSGNYEVLATFELLDWDAWGAVGLAVGWSGHEGNANPRVDWPTEGLTWVRNVLPNSEMQIMTFEKGVQVRTPFSLELETPYKLRARTTRSGDQANVSMRIWPADESEPSTWTLTTKTIARDGGVLLVNHHSKVRWSTVRVTAAP
jgi:hypothetical protein